MKKRLARGFSLVEMLVVIVIIGVLAAILLPRYIGGAKSASKKTAGSPVQKAHGVECQNNLSQIRMAYQMATAAGDENRPHSLADLRPQGVTESISRCPVGGEPYRFDPATGRVMCPHPGHQGF